MPVKVQRLSKRFGWVDHSPQPVLLIDEPLDGLDLRHMGEVPSALRLHASISDDAQD